MPDSNRINLTFDQSPSNGTMTIDELCSRLGIPFDQMEAWLDSAIEQNKYAPGTDVWKLRDLLRTRRLNTYRVNVAEVMRNSVRPK